MIHYSPGTPTWAELRSPDIDASVAFYCELFGWKAGEEKPSSGYRMFSSGGEIVAGIRPLLGTQLSPQWITYVSTDDEARTVSRAQTAGGKVLMETGRDTEMGMIILQDPLGALFGIFQDDLFGGAQLFNQPISLTFNLLMTRQPLAGKRFYSEVFGWEPRDRDLGSGFAFTYFFHGVRGVAGLMAMNERWPQAVPSHWQVSFAVEDADALASRAIELGGKAQPPITTPFGRSALLTDPYGATFSISQQTPQVRAAAQTPEGVLAFLI
jgi:predicted enzyme related to lactoylglutathione lyase